MWEVGEDAAELTLDTVEDVEAIRSEWDRLSALSGNVFATPEWAEAWLERFLDGRPLALQVGRGADGEIAVILPLYQAATMPLRVFRLIGHGAADELGPVCGLETIPAAARALRRLAGRGSGGGALLLDRLAGGANWPELLGAPALKRESSPVLRIDGRSWEEFLASRSRNFREQVARRERKLAREHRIEFSLLRDEEGFDEEFSTFLRLHGLRRGDGGSALAGTRGEFHRAFARVALRRGWLRLWTLKVDGEPVASWYGLRFAGAESYYNAGRDPAWDAASVGFVLLVHTIREAFADGLREYRFLLGAEAYKDRFADHDGGLDTVLVAPGAIQRLGAAGAAIVRRLPPAARRKVNLLG